MNKIIQMSIFSYFRLKKCLIFLAFLLLPVFLVFADDIKKIENYEMPFSELSKESSALAWSKNGKYFAVGSWNEVTVWNALNDEIIANFSSKNIYERFIDVAFSDFGEYLLSLRSDGSARIYNLSNNEQESFDIQSGDKIISSISYNNSSFDIIFSGGNDKIYESFKLMITDRTVIKEKITLSGNVVFMCASPSSNRLLVLTDDDKVSLIDTISWNVISSYDCPKNANFNPTISLNGERIVLPSGKNGFSVLGNDGFEKNFSSDTERWTSVAISNYGNILAIGTADGYVKIKDIESGVTKYELRLNVYDEATGLAFSPDSNSLLIDTKKNFVYRWNFLKGQKLIKKNTKPKNFDFNRDADDDKKNPKKSKSTTNNSNENASENSKSNAKSNSNESNNEIKDSVNDKNSKNDKSDKNSKNDIPLMPRPAIVFSLGYESIPKDYFLGSFIIRADWRHYFKKIVYVGTNLGFGFSLPTDNLSYYANTTKSPSCYDFFAGGVFGTIFYSGKKDFGFFMEMAFGGNGRFLFNNDFNNKKSSDIFPSWYGSFELGILWKYLKISGNITYDSNFKLRFGGNVGVNVPLHKK